MSSENHTPETYNPDNPQTISLEYTLSLYERYATDLLATREYLSGLLATQSESSEHMRIQFDDLEAELMYLLIRDKDPRRVVEISPRDGWSSLWILKALQDNGASRLFGPGHLDSFDLLDTSSKFIPEELKPLRTMHVGDVRHKQEELPEEIDFLLMDSAHNAVFASWYVQNVFPRVKLGAPIIVHDIQQPIVRRIPGTEAHFLKRFLKQNGINYFSMSGILSEKEDYINKETIKSWRRTYSIDSVPLHEGRMSPTAWYNRMLLHAASLLVSGQKSPFPESKGNPAVFLMASESIK